jgi:hypothetical protein
MSAVQGNVISTSSVENPRNPFCENCGSSVKIAGIRFPKSDAKYFLYRS